MNKLKKSKGIENGIEYPETFTLPELCGLYPNAVEVTLRNRIQRAKDNRIIVDLGKIKLPVGRPNVVYAKLPLTKELVKSQMDKGVHIYEEHYKYMPVPTKREISEATAAIFGNKETVSV